MSLKNDERVKTDMRLSRAVACAADELSKALGVPKNAVFAFALAHLYLTYSALSPQGRKRLDLLEALEKQLREGFAAARKAC